jgi:membrane-associated phospholipid phosphatase
MNQHKAGPGVLAVSALLAAGPVAAQERPVGDDLSSGVKDILHVWSAPAHARANDLEGVGAVALLFSATLPLDEPVQQWLADNPRSLPVRMIGPFRESNPLNLAGRTVALLPTSVAMYLAGLAFDSAVLRDAGIGCATSNIASTLSRTTLNRLVGRVRPGSDRGAFAFEPFTFDDWEVRSFPGGHASNIMSCVSYWNHRFEMGAVEPVLYGFAGAIGTARTVDGAHWLSDTVMGLAFGYAVGKAVAARLNGRADDDAAPGPTAATLTWTIRF